ncbi:type II toxin-antitoxin system HipA family toxin [Geotalea uraniireducens]|uniref:type II toxin-antitoxin system HipA family toxin n=1 Tax=Geotalea uraniireducens TaxID=351604 RepID=UPI000301B8F3|nr:HipA domain-containing protein [Geotalea uraniireducens]
MAREHKVYVFIYLPGETTAVPAGLFTHYPDDGIGRFAYGRRYLERPNALPVDPVALPLGGMPRDVTTNGGLYGAFRDSSPDYWGRLVVAAEARMPPEALDETDYLLRANASRIGCLDFRASLEQGEPVVGPPGFQSLAELLDAASDLAAGKQVRQDLLRLLEQGSSVGGARPKCTVELDDALWIAKFPAKDDTINFPKVEYATMTLAGRCGINVPTMRVVAIGGRDVLLVKRFDRHKSGGGYQRFGFLSALSLMEWDERDRTEWSYPALADRMRATILAQRAQTGELFRRMLFNVLCRNTDDHPRNHGFLWGERATALSPAYDIVPSLARPGVTTEFSLSMSLGERGREATLANAVSMHARFGLTRSEAEQVIDDMRACVAKWEQLFITCGVSEADRDAVRASFAVATS